MAAEVVGAYHFVLTIGGVDVGFILYKDQSGNLSWYEGLAEKYAPQSRVQTFSYEHLPPDVDQPLAAEDWSGGAGYDTVRTADGVSALTKYSYSRGVNMSYSKKFMLAHKLEALLEDDGTAIADVPTCFYYSPSYGLFMGAGSYIYEFDFFTSQWSQRLAGSGTIKSIREHDGVLYASAGASTDYYYSGNGVSWTAYTAEDENADFFETRSNVLWKLKGQALKNSTTPTTTGWTGSDKFGHTTMTVSSFLQADGSLWGFYREGIFEYTGSAVSEVWRAPIVKSTNGKNPFYSGNGMIYLPYGNYLMQFDPSGASLIEAVYPLTEHITNREITGTITAVAGDERFLYVAVENADGNNYIMKGDVNTNKWDTWVYLGTKQATVMQWVPEGVGHTTNPVLMVGCDDTTINRVVLPRMGFTPDTDTACQFETSGTVYFPNWDYGALAFPKFLNEGDVSGTNVTATNTITLKYEKDNEGSYTTIVSAIDSGHSSEPVTTEVEFNVLRPVVVLASGSRYTTPVCDGIAVHATGNPPRRRQWNLTIILANDLLMTDGQIDVEQDVRWVKDMLRQAVNRRATLTDRSGETAFVIVRDMQGKGIRPVMLGGEERDVEVIDLTLVEVTRLTSQSQDFYWGVDAYGGGKVWS